MRAKKEKTQNSAFYLVSLGGFIFLLFTHCCCVMLSQITQVCNYTSSLFFSLHPSVRASADALARLQAGKAEIWRRWKKSIRKRRDECENECVWNHRRRWERVSETRLAHTTCRDGGGKREESKEPTFKYFYSIFTFSLLAAQPYLT